VLKYCKVREIWNILLPKLKNNYKLGVLNNGTAITIPYFKKENNFNEFFPTFINSSEVNLEKPDSKIYLMTLEQMGLKPEESVFIDDTEKNVFGAKNVGMYGLLFTNYQNLLIDLKSLGINL
jgi:FMN phosphatase YigB (HAD superfamily)